MPQQTSPIAKYHLIEIALAGRIRAGAYPDGALPAERRLAEEFGVARVTIRHALRRLEDQGLIARPQRRGTPATTVASATGSAAAGAAPRPRLLREHVDQFLDRGRPDQRKVLRFGPATATHRVAQALGLAAGDPVLRIVRLRSRAGLPLTYTESFIPGRLAHIFDRAQLGRQALIQALEDGGVKVGAADQSVRADRCPADIAAALRLTAHEPVLCLERVVYDDTAVPVQMLLGWYRADAFDIQMHMSRADDLTRVWMRAR